MKKLLILLCSLLLLTGCKSPTGKQLVPDDERLSSSMKNIYAEECQEYVKGERFQIKVCSLVKVENELQNVYRYQVLVAPLTDAKVAIKSITFEPDHADVFAAASSYVAFSGISQGYFMLQLPMWEKVNDFEAYRFDFTFDNISNENEKVISDLNKVTMDEMMQNLSVTIEYNLFDKETIEVSINNMDVVRDADDELLKRSDISMIYYHQTSWAGAMLFPYDDEHYPLSRTVEYREIPVETFAKKKIRELGYYDTMSSFEMMEHVSALDNQGLYYGIPMEILPESVRDPLFSETWNLYPVYKDGKIIFAVKAFSENMSVVDDMQTLERLDKIISDQGERYVVQLEGSVYAFDRPLFKNDVFCGAYEMLAGEADEKVITNNLKFLQKMERYGSAQNINLSRRTRLFWEGNE